MYNPNSVRVKNTNKKRNNNKANNNNNNNNVNNSPVVQSNANNNNNNNNSNTPIENTNVNINNFVVHVRKGKYDVYIGRYNPSVEGGTNPKWGNPFKIGSDGDRDDVISKYENWLLAQPQLIEEAKKELKGKVLACWCAPQSCHGHVLARVANE